MLAALAVGQSSDAGRERLATVSTRPIWQESHAAEARFDFRKLGEWTRQAPVWSSGLGMRHRSLG